MTIAQQAEEDGNFVHLNEESEYQRYFKLLTRASEILSQWYKRVVDGAGYEEEIIAMFLGKLRFSAQMFALKHSYCPDSKLRLDLNQSGFPHLLGVMSMESDLRRRDEVLRLSNTPLMIRQAMLAWMFENKTEPTAHLEEMALRQYFEKLDQEKILFQFTPGKLLFQSEDHLLRHYLFSWACYDVETNVPHVYIMLFDQDVSEEPLHAQGPNYARFMEVVRSEGSRVPTQLMVVASAIDQSLESIHPKILKRIKLGPLFSKEFSREEHSLIEYLRTYGDEDDFIFHIRDEMVFSGSQVIKKGGWLTPTTVREIFAIQKDDMECAAAGASRIYRTLVLPHHIVQHLDRTHPAVTQYNGMVSYSRKGEVYGV